MPQRKQAATFFDNYFIFRVILLCQAVGEYLHYMINLIFTSPRYDIYEMPAYNLFQYYKHKSVCKKRPQLKVFNVFFFKVTPARR
jgi:hypothetical protein